MSVIGKLEDCSSASSVCSVACILNCKEMQ
jgi:hypothetical protein